MTKLKQFASLFVFSVLISYLTLFLPESKGITVGTFENRQTQTTELVREIYASGFPLKFYIPGGFDYGANFMTEGFVINTVIIFIFLLSIYFATQKFIKKQE